MLSQWETGQRFPSLPYLVKIATVFDVNINYLFGLCVDVAPDTDATYTGAMLNLVNTMFGRVHQTLVKAILKQTRRILPDCETSALLEQVNRSLTAISTANLPPQALAELQNLKVMSQQIHNRQQHRLRLIDRAVQDAIEHEDHRALGHLALWEYAEGD